MANDRVEYPLPPALRPEPAGRSWTLWGLALLLAWVGYVLLNLVLGWTDFAHLERMPALTLGEWQRFTRTAAGATRLETTGQALFPRADLLKDVIVVSGSHARLVTPTGPAGRPALRLTADRLARLRQVLEGNLNLAGPGVDPPAGREDPLARLALIRLSFLRLRHAYAEDAIPASPSATPENPVHAALRKAETAILTDTPAGRTIWALDAWELTDAQLDTAIDTAETALRAARDELAALGVVPALPEEPAASPDTHPRGRPALEAFLRDMDRLVPLEPNPHLERFPQAGPQSTPPAGITIAYLPPRRAGDSRPDYAFCLEVAPAGGWWSGWSVGARYTLVAPDNPLMPVRRSAEPVAEVLHRGPGWPGFRPTSVRITEGQLADRFFAALQEVRTGAGVGPELGPEEEEQTRCKAFVRRVLEARLGHVAPVPTVPRQSPDAYFDAAWRPDVPDAGPDAQFAGKPRALDEWIVLARRLNGGNAWGIIQFLVVVLAVRFALEWLAVFRLVARADRRLAGLPTALLPAEYERGLTEARAGRPERLLDLLRLRTHTLSGIVAVLPVVGFLGTVAGLSTSLIGSSGVSSESAPERQAALQAMEIALGTAFDKSLLAFAATIGCMTAGRWMSWRIARLGRPAGSGPDVPPPIASQ